MRVNNQLRSTVGQDKMCDLSLLTIEAVLTNNINFERIVAEFAKLKYRKTAIVRCLCLAACSELWRLKSNILYCIVEKLPE